MPNLSSFTRLVGASAGAAFLALLASPLARADADSAYTDLSIIYGDVSAFENSFGPYEDTVFYSDLASVGNIIDASGIDIGDSFSSGATASADLSSIAAEGSTITGQLSTLEQTIASEPAGYATINGNELPVITDMLAFQDQINTDIANLPTIVTQDETNPLVIADLSALYGREIDFSNDLVNLGYVLDSPAGITDDNAAILSEGLGIVTDVQSTADSLTLLADLSSLGL